jgi:hypothetical protein
MLVTRRIRLLATAAVATVSFGATAGTALALNPQPLPPMPAVTGLHFLNPQPLPPIVD